ncbi:MAG: hypothetical protein ACXVX9_07660 [Mycobacteriaceae bacterium]
MSTRANERGLPRLKEVALQLGAHAHCMREGRDGSCRACRDIVDRIIDRAHTKPGSAA